MDLTYTLPFGSSQSINSREGQASRQLQSSVKSAIVNWGLDSRKEGVINTVEGLRRGKGGFTGRTMHQLYFKG